MTYVCSDLHGFWERYTAFLDAVSFGGRDTLYIIGDAVDRGSEGIRILRDVMTRKNVFLLKGNHEHMVLPILKELCGSNKASQTELIRNEANRSPIGQEDTLKDFCRLSTREQTQIMDYLNSLPLSLTVTVNSQKYLLVHAGLPDFSDMDIHYYTEDELLFGPHDFSIRHFKATIIIVGHVPTRFIPGAEPDKIFRRNDSIAIDCGLGFGGKLGILCLDTGEEFYF